MSTLRQLLVRMKDKILKELVYHISCDSCDAFKLTINLMKSEFGQATVKYLGHIVGQGQVRPLDAKIQTIAKFWWAYKTL